jgi:hypothetical protein
MLLLSGDSSQTLADRRSTVRDVTRTKLRVESNAGVTVQHLRGSGTTSGPITDRSAELRLERRPGGVNGRLAFDVRLDREGRRAKGWLSWDVLGLHGCEESVPQGLGRKGAEYRRSQFAFRVGPVPQPEARQVLETLVDAAGIGSYMGDDPIQFPQLGQKHAPR